ncbi:MAG TPA: hypothetical protein VGF35_06250, partial [Steroidobacteraceae bacterium]
SRSILANNERTINWFPEQVGDKLVLYPVAGLRPWTDTGWPRARATFSENGRTFVVMANQFIEVFAGGNWIVRGGVVEDQFPAQIVGNGAGGQLLIASGGWAGVYALATNTLTNVLQAEAHQIGMLDGYFLAFNRTLGKLRYSKAGDGSSWDPLDYVVRSVASDNWVAMTVNQGRIWLIGEHSGEVWWHAGGSTIFAPIPSSQFSWGIIAPYSLLPVGDAVRWLSQTPDGDGIIVSAKGYRPERISDHATEHAIAGYRQTASITDCEALTYQSRGHTFTVFRFPAADATRVFDDVTGLWHERAFWDPATARWRVWRPRVHMMAFGQHVVGDAQTSTLSILDETVSTDLGAGIRRVRVLPTLHGDGERVFVDRIELYLEPGLAPQPGNVAADPQVMLSLSYDGGKTWGNERRGSAGLVGQYHRRVAWPRCGSGWAVTPMLTCSDPVPWNLIDCFVDASGMVAAAPQASAQAAG